jgi:hypothetical protein
VFGEKLIRALPCQSSSSHSTNDSIAASLTIMAHVNFPSNLPDLLQEKFNQAKEAGDLNFWPTEVTVLHVNGVPVGFSSAIPTLHQCR